MTKFYKKVLPTFWFGFLATFVTATVLSGAATKEPIFLVVPIAMSVFGFVLMRKLVWDLVDDTTRDHRYKSQPKRTRVCRAEVDYGARRAETPKSARARLPRGLPSTRSSCDGSARSF